MVSLSFRVMNLALLCLLIALITAFSVSCADDVAALKSCLQSSMVRNFTDPTDAQRYNIFLTFSLRNLRYAEPGVRKPALIVLPNDRGEVQRTVTCCVRTGWQMRIRSGGHSYEGLSSTADGPFVIVDLMRIDRVTVDLPSSTAWVEAGATLGQVYSAIASVSTVHAFPAGTCPTVGSGGHVSGGGIGMLTRKYGLASDNIVDALLVDAAGNLLDKNSMPADVFWALRGGGGGSWGVVVAWRIRLVIVPRVVTVFSIPKTTKQSITSALSAWQNVAPSADEDLFVRVGITRGTEVNLTATFEGLYLGNKIALMTKLNATWQWLGATSDALLEMSWLESVAHFSNTQLSKLAKREQTVKNYFKNKSDVSRSIWPKQALDAMLDTMDGQHGINVIMSPLGGIMGRISASTSPFPHRDGWLFDVQYLLTWKKVDPAASDDAFMSYMRRLYAMMAAYVSNPRAAYVNYEDLDLGFAVNGSATVEQGTTWGESYFGINYDRLVRAKTLIDPSNVFRHPQSIPPNPSSHTL